MCKYIDLYENNSSTHPPSTLELETWSSCRPQRGSSSKLSVMLKANVLDSQHQKPKKNTSLPLFPGDHNRGIAFASNRAHIVRSYTCSDHHLSHLSVSHRHKLQLSSVSGVLHRASGPDTLTSYHEWPSLESLALPRLLRHLAQDRRLFRLPTRHRAPRSIRLMRRPQA